MVLRDLVVKNCIQRRGGEGTAKGVRLSANRTFLLLTGTPWRAYRRTMLPEDPLTFLGETDWRNQHRPFGIRRSDRRYHMAVIGRTGMGKSTLMKTMAFSDIAKGEGLALLDPHGDLAEEVVQVARQNRPQDTVYFNPAEPDGTLGFNILEAAGVKPHLVASGVISVMKKFWEDFWGPKMEHILRHALLSLVGIPNATLADVSRILLDKDFRRWVIGRITDAKIREFWLQEYERYTAWGRMDAASPILNKIGQFIANPDIRRLICQPKSSFDLRAIMDAGRIFVANLSRGKLGEDASALLGALLVTKFELAALARADVPPEARREFFLYVDEFPTLATPSFAGIMAESRKYSLAITVGMQYVDQIERTLRDAVFENVGSIAVFRGGPGTASILAPQLEDISEEDVMNLPKYSFYMRLMYEGQPQAPFSARTIQS